MVTHADNLVVAEDEARAMESRGRVFVALAPSLVEDALYVELPGVGELVERGGLLCRVLTRGGRIVRVTSPISGRVLEANTEDLRCTTWVAAIEA